MEDADRIDELIQLAVQGKKPAMSEPSSVVAVMPWRALFEHEPFERRHRTFPRKHHNPQG